jgi:hypothetical protein
MDIKIQLLHSFYSLSNLWKLYQHIDVLLLVGLHRQLILQVFPGLSKP